MNKETAWKKFKETGNIQFYLKYKELEAEEEDE